MNILLLFTYNTSLLDWYNAGLLNRELKLYENLNSKFKIKFTFVTFGDKQDFELVKNYPFINVIPIYDYLPRRKNKYINFFKILFSINQILLDRNANFDLIKTNQLNGAWIAAIIKFKYKTPLYVRTGYDLFLFSIKDKKNPMKIIFYYFITFLMLNYSEIYSVSSSSDYKFIKKYFLFKKQKLLLRRNWIPIKKYSNLNHRYESKFLTVGRLVIQKDFEFLIKFFNSSKFELDIVGEGPLQNLLVEKASSNINFLGKLDFLDLFNLYKKYKFFILSSKFEGNPKSLIEAMANGCIVIVPEVLNNIEIVKNEVNGFTYKKNNRDLKLLINKLSTFNLDTISKNAYEFVKTNYSLDRYSEIEIEDYRKLIQKTHS